MGKWEGEIGIFSCIVLREDSGKLHVVFLHRCAIYHFLTNLPNLGIKLFLVFLVNMLLVGPQKHALNCTGVPLWILVEHLGRYCQSCQWRNNRQHCGLCSPRDSFVRYMFNSLICLDWPKTSLLPTYYNWIAHQLEIERRPAFLLSVSDFKYVTSFGFLIENYTSHVVWFL